MSTLHTLFRVFAQFILKVSAIYAVAALVGVLALDKLFGGYEYYLGTLVFVGPMLAWVLTFMLVPKNLDWIMALPISKRNVLVLHYMTSVFATLVTSVASAVVIVLLVIINRDVHVDVHQVAKAAPSAVVPQAQLASMLAGIDIYGWMTAFLMISFFHALSMSISRPAATRRLYANLWNDANPVIRWSIRAGWLGVIALAAMFREYLLSPFGVFLVAITAFLLVTTFNTAHALGVGRQQRRWWLAVSGAIAVAQIAFLFAHAMSGVRANSFDRRVASVMFLGPMSGGMARDDLARLLEGEINEERIDDLGALYRKRFWGRRKIRASEEKSLSFFRAVDSKKTFQDVVSTLRLFDPEDLDAANLRALFAKLQPLATECRCELPLHELLPARFNADDALELLGSGEDSAIQYSLLWARYRALGIDHRFSQAIMKGMPGYSDKAKLSALLTLSVLDGRRYGLNDWLEQARSRGRSLSSARTSEIDCLDWKVTAVADLTSKDVPMLNYCVRRRTELSHAAEIESIGWFEPPLDSKARVAVRKALKIR